MTVHWPSLSLASAPTQRVPEAWPKHSRDGSVPGRSARCTTVPGTAPAAAMATAPVPVIAWCSLPMETMRAVSAISPASTALPLAAR